MEDSQTVVKLDSEDVLLVALAILEYEHIAVVLVWLACRIERVLAAVHNLLCSVSSLLEIESVVSSVSRKSRQSRLTGVILSECTLEETELSLESKSRVLVYTELRCRCRKVLDSIVDVLEHMLHNDLTVVSWVEESLISRAELNVDPRNVSESLHFLKVEVSAEELCESSVLLNCIFIVTVVDVRKKGVHLSEVTPRPAAS